MNLGFVFVGGSFHYIYFRAIKTAIEVHKHDKAVLYYVDEPDDRKYFDLLPSIGVKIKKIKENYDWAIGLKNKGDKFFRANVKDLILWDMAYKHGGIFLDLDTISYKDISDLLGDKDLVVANDVPPDLKVLHAYNAAVMVTRKGSPILKRLYERAVERAKDPEVKWGDLNCTLITGVVTTDKKKVMAADYGVLGGFGANHIINYFEGRVPLPENCRILHLFASSTKEHSYLPEWSVSDWLKRRGVHYKPMFDYLENNEVHDILEIGTFNGDNAIGMIKTSKSPENTINYTGVDLFSQQDETSTDKEVNFGYNNPPSMIEVRNKLSSTFANIKLYKGDSRKILPTIKGKFDFIYIDGGHSIETIESDWKNAEKLLKKDGMVFFDDYFVDRDDIGCKFLYDKNKQKYDITIHPEVDDYGLFKSKLMSFNPSTGLDKKYRFHVLGLVHLPTSEEYMACAFTQKNVKLCKMLLAMGHEVYLYGAEGSTAPCTKFIQTHTLKDIRDDYGEGDNRYDIGYDWHSGQFKHDINDSRKPSTIKFYQKAITEINKIKRLDDFLVITQGTYQRPVDHGVNLYLTVETGIGYRGSYAKWRAFESSYIQNFTYGSEHPRESINGAFYDRVVPNYFDTKDFPFVGKKDDYFLFMGRMIQRKGVFIALEACEHIGKKLILAGQLSDEFSLDDVKKYKCAEFVGFADAKKRAELMGKAKAVFTPSTYLEPF